MDFQNDLFTEDENTSEYIFSEEDLILLEKLKNISIDAYEAANWAGLNSTMHVNIGSYIKHVLAAADTAEKNALETGVCIAFAQILAREAADRAAHDRGVHIVESILAASYKVTREHHRLLGFLRFVPAKLLSNDPSLADCIPIVSYYLARCAPDHFILPAMADHFSARFGENPWAVIDEKRNLLLIQRPDQAPSLEALVRGENNSLNLVFENDEEKDPVEDLWRLYNRSVLIQNRKNLKLQKQFVPLRYRKYLSEFED